MKKRGRRTKGVMLVAFLLFAVVLGALVFRKYQTATRQVEQVPQPPSAAQVVTLFFGAADGEGLVREGREVEPEETLEGTVQTVLEDLARGPLGDHAPTLPANTRVLAVRLKGGIAEVDFGRELQEGLPGGSSAELTAVYSVVDTLAANFPQIQGVQFLIEGVRPETLKGHLDLRAPIAPDFTLERKQAAAPEEAAPAR